MRHPENKKDCFLFKGTAVFLLAVIVLFQFSFHAKAQAGLAEADTQKTSLPAKETVWEEHGQGQAEGAFGPRQGEIYRKARPSRDGWLHVYRTGFANAAGEEVQLRGVSTHGLTWYPDYVNEKLFRFLSEDWDCNFIRLAMYSEDYIHNREENLRLLHQGIEAAIAADMYVLVDWHILDDYNPMINLSEAAVFFDGISREYADTPNLIYEICNEPNQDTVWDDVYEYANEIIPIIRKNAPDAVIVVGTPNYDQDLDSPVYKRLDDPNTMYVFHFYTTSHHDEMMKTLKTAVDAGLPVFISECGITEADGNGAADYEYAAHWFTYLHEQNISYIIWNLSNKEETSSFIKATSGAYEEIRDEDLTDTGLWVRTLIRGDLKPVEIKPGAAYQSYSFLDRFVILVRSLGRSGLVPVKRWWIFALFAAALLLAAGGVWLYTKRRNRNKILTYDDIVRHGDPEADTKEQRKLSGILKQALILLLLFISIIYLGWRIVYSINTAAGWLAVACNIILLVVEGFGFIESCIHYYNMMHIRERRLPEIGEEEYPEVDVFIATYNEPEELIRKTVNGCLHLKYPDKSKVHIWVCDDKRRPGMRKLAETMGVGYFDRPDNQGAKAGNLNHAMGLTSAPYIVTLDADMIVQSDFLLKTIPYFVYAEKCQADLPEEKRRHLGLLQTPQSFYDPDVFQYGLYSERNIPNEQDFFYRTIEPAKTATNSVIYGGSNTVLSRAALEDIGGFYTSSITEDFATGFLIEAAGYASLGLGEPLASGLTPSDFKDHVKQRTRWGRGVINTAKDLHPLSRRELTLGQKLSYWSSVVYWYSPLKNLIYVISPLLFAVCTIPVFRCNWLELLVYWLPMFLLQAIALRVLGKNVMSLKWSSIYELSVMPYLLLPILKESLGISMKKFQVTDKTGRVSRSRRENLVRMLPFLILILLSVIGIIRVCWILNGLNAVGIVIILFWLIRNLYSLVMCVFLINGRDLEDDADAVKVYSGEMSELIRQSDGAAFSGITTLMTEHSMSLFLDEAGQVRTGDLAKISIETMDYQAALTGIVTHVRHLRHSEHVIADVEILDMGEDELTYLQILYDRVPTLPQTLKRDSNPLGLLWRNVVYRLMRTV